jgi:MFS family permease
VVLQAQAVGVPIMLVPAVLLVMNAVYALSAYPAGVLADNGGRFRILVFGVILLLAADLVLSFAPGIAGTAIGVAVWGLHMGATQGLLATLIADNSPAELRGTAFGMFNLLTGAALLVSSVIAGVLWDRIGAQATFLGGAVLAGLSLLGFLAIREHITRRP